MRRLTVSVWHVLIIVSLVLTAGCSQEKEETAEQTPNQGNTGQVPVEIPQETGYFGWDTAVLRTSYIELHVLPESGGRIMGYDAFGSRLLWHDPAHEGETGDFNIGGALVYPAGAEIGDWPAAMSPYEAMNYEADFTDSTFTMTSPDGGDYRISVEGSLDPLSTVFRQRYTLERTASGSGRAGLRQAIQIPVDGDITVYAPVANGGWNVIAGGEDNPQWLGVEDGMFRARYDRRYGRVGLKLREGWLAWRNASNGLTCVVRFPVDGAFPDGYQVEIRTLGEGAGPDGQLAYDPETARMEVVIMSRLENLDSGETLRSDTRWEVCRVSDIVDVLPNGVLSQEFMLRDGKFTGKFGIFKGGHLRYVYLDAKKESIGYRNMYQINPLNEVVVEHGMDHFTFPPQMEYLGFKAVDSRFNDLQSFGDIELPE